MNTSSSGASSAGITSEIVAIGAMDAFLIKGATGSFFRYRYARHKKFAMEAVTQYFTGNVAFGSTVDITFNRVGDLVYYLYVVIELPGIYAVGTANNISNNYPAIDNIAPYATTADYSNIAASTDPTVAVPKYEAYLETYYQNKPHLGGFFVPDVLSSMAAADDDLIAHSVISPATGHSQQIAISTNGAIPWVHWHNAIGQLLVARATIIVGGHVTDEVFSDYLYFWEELTGKAGKRLEEMIGKRKSRRQLISDARSRRRYYVPLPFSCTQNPGNCIPLISLQYHGIRLNVLFEQLKNCLCVSDSKVLVVRTDTGAPLTANDLTAWVNTTYIYLDDEERDAFSVSNFDQLITQVQAYAPQSKSAKNVNLRLVFNHPCIEMIWAVRREIHETNNNYFNYSGIDGRDPIDQVQLRFNNQPRFELQQGSYFRLLQPYQFHTNIPQAHIYCYSFSLDPESPQPSGSVNLSRIDNVEMFFSMQTNLEKENTRIIFFVRNFNVIRYIEGAAGVLFQ